MGAHGEAGEAASFVVQPEESTACLHLLKIDQQHPVNRQDLLPPREEVDVRSDLEIVTVLRIGEPCLRSSQAMPREQMIVEIDVLVRVDTTVSVFHPLPQKVGCPLMRDHRLIGKYRVDCGMQEVFFDSMTAALLDQCPYDGRCFHGV